MMIEWREQAEADLVGFLLERNVTVALRTRDIIVSRVALLADQPALGRPGRVARTRELVIGSTPSIVAYRIAQSADAVIILRVLHGARQWPVDLGR